jgi:hypothetical protein
LTTESAHEGALQRAFVHTPLLQSESAEHDAPSSQAGQLPPPQSLSGSLPSAMPSVHVAGRQTSPSQCREAQSSFDLHARFVAQRAQSGPPQSSSVSDESIF